MNERIGNNKIYLLAKEAGLIEFEQLDWNPELVSPTYESVAKARKFAELILKECVQTLIDNTPERYTNEAAEEDWDKGYDRAMRDCVHHIQEHFGVEE